MVEPKYPGAVERYVNMGDCYDKQALWPLRKEIMDCMAGYKGCYQRAYRCLGAAAEIMEDQRATLITDALSQKLAKRAKGIHQGPVCLYDTALAQCGRIYALSDSCGLAHELLIHLLAGTAASGYDAVACPDPMAPDRLAHVLVPQLGLAFLSAAGELPPEIRPYRHIRLDAAADGELLRRSRPRLRFARKVSAALAEEAVASLAQAKAMHDDLEAIYNPHVDFGLVERTAQDVWEEIASF